MTFGEYFRKLLKERNINLSKLAVKASIKSKNEIYRIFDNKYSYNKTKKLTEQILSVIDIEEEEKNTLYNLMECCKIKNSTRKAWGILEGLYKGIEVKRDENTEKIEKRLKKNKKSKIKIFIGSEIDTNIALFLDNFLSENHGYNISIIHSINFNKSEDIIAGELFSLIKLLPNEEYKCFEVSKSELKGIMGLIDTSESYQMFAVTEKNEYVESPISKELYEFLDSRYSQCENGVELKDMRGHITDYAYAINFFSVMETNNTFSFEGLFGFADIPFDVMYSMLMDANYFGLPPDSTYIQNMVKAARDRHELRTNSNSTRFYAMSYERVKDVFSTGKTIDHIDAFRPLTKEEIKIMVNYFIKGRDRFKYRFLKPDYSNKCTECNFVENFAIVMIDGSLGYGKKHFQTVISHPKAMSVFKSFTEYFWDNCTLSDEESKEKLEELITKYLN